MKAGNETYIYIINATILLFSWLNLYNTHPDADMVY